MADRRGVESQSVTWPSGPPGTGDLPRLVPRRRLLERLGDAVQHHVTVLTAPAGFGKSVLLDQWIATQAGEHPVVRLTLHRADDPSLVTARLAAALDWLGGLDSIGGATFVFDGLDDAPGNPAVAEHLGALIEHVPLGLRVVVACRSRWSAAGGRLRLPTDPVCIDEAELAFTPVEARLLLRDVSGRDVHDRQLDALLVRTEGWAVGLHLAGIALRHAVDADAVIDAFAGDDRYVAGYLHDEVLDHEPAPVRRFLAHTAVLDQLSGPLCDAVTGDRDGAAMLGRLEQRGLFTCRTAPGDTYAYHPLFRDLLRRELRLSDPDAEATLLARAAAWHLARQEPEPAARFLIEAANWDHLIELIDRWGRPMFERGASDKVLGWLDAIPGSRQLRRRGLAVRRAYLHTMLGDTRLAAQIVHDLDIAGLRPAEEILVNTLRATWAFWDASPRSVIRAADAALGALDTVDPDELPNILGLTSPASLKIMAAGSRARALWYLGDTPASRRAFHVFLHDGDAYPPWRAHVLGGLALLEAWAGNLRVAHQHARQAFTLAARARLLEHPATIDARLAVAHVWRERGHLQRADVLLDEAQAIATRTRPPTTLAVHATERALWHLAAGDPRRGTMQIEQGHASGDLPLPPAIQHRLRVAEVRLLVASGEIERARSILDAESRTGRLPPALSAVAVQTSIASGDLVAARTHLDAWDPDNLEPGARLEHELWTAIADGDDRRTALQRLSAVVTQASAEGHVRLFLDAGRPAERLLRDLLHTAPTPFLRRLVRCADQGRHVAIGQAANELSERELEVVRYLPTSLSSIEIAGQLYISLNTLKTHLQAIYRKLGVNGRRDAVRRAEELG